MKWVSDVNEYVKLRCSLNRLQCASLCFATVCIACAASAENTIAQLQVVDRAEQREIVGCMLCCQCRSFVYRRNEARLTALKTAYATALRIPTTVEKLSPQEIYSSIKTAADTLQTAQVLERSDDYVIASV